MIYIKIIDLQRWLVWFSSYQLSRIFWLINYLCYCSFNLIYFRNMWNIRWFFSKSLCWGNSLWFFVNRILFLNSWVLLYISNSTWATHHTSCHDPFPLEYICSLPIHNMRIFDLPIVLRYSVPLYMGVFDVSTMQNSSTLLA